MGTYYGSGGSRPLYIKCKCGGDVLFDDMRTRASREYRYEAFCSSCGSCDPNGYATIRELKRETPKHWNPDTPNPTRQEPQPTPTENK